MGAGPKGRILFVASAPSAVPDLIDSLGDDGYQVDIRPFDSNAGLNDAKFDAALVDVGDSAFDGFAAIRAVRSLGLGIPIVALSAEPDFVAVHKALRAGAIDFLAARENPTVILKLLRRLLKTEIGHVQRPLPGKLGDSLEIPASLVGGSPAMVTVYKLILRAAAVDTTVLLTGETGTGKEVVTRAIHRIGPRSASPYLGVDCAALPGDLFESELFGHERGAFTGAYAMHQGVFETAGDGTCFLDEIGELDTKLQSKLLRALQERMFRRVGGRETLSVRARIVAATNRDLAEMVRDGRFREDLYYRLNVLAIHLPPLRERREDVPLLVRGFMARQAAGAGQSPPIVSPEAMELLAEYDWPGNVRQLENVLERAVTMTPYSVVLPEDLPADIVAAPAQSRIVWEERTPVAAIDNGSTETIKSLTVHHVLEVLERTGGNKVRAAQLLGIDRRTLYRILSRAHLPGHT